MDIVITNCIKMLKARKYTNMEQSEEDNIITANDSSGKNVMVIILNEDRLNISSVKECIVTFATHDINIGILFLGKISLTKSSKTFF